MSSVNKVILVGHLGKDPELRQAGGQAVCELRLATTDNYAGKDGAKQESTEWHSVVVWGKQAESCARYLSKGRQVYVEGRLRTRSWEKDGAKQYRTEVVASTVQFLSGAGKGDGPAAAQTGDDDSIPF
ncbi:MAG TPA: single-stranded DNA-binding protein [Polyangia bacterium]|jgi:single-strand DNA-binding protein